MVLSQITRLRFLMDRCRWFKKLRKDLLYNVTEIFFFWFISAISSIQFHLRFFIFKTQSLLFLLYSSCKFLFPKLNFIQFYPFPHFEPPHPHPPSYLPCLSTIYWVKCILSLSEWSIILVYYHLLSYSQSLW